VNPLFAAALDLQQFCRARSWRFCFIGGLAVQRWGEPRLTLDVDCSIMTGIGDEIGYVDALLSAYAARVDGPREFALSHRVLLVSHPSGIPLDISLGAMSFEAHTIERASPLDIGGGQSLMTCSAEDLIVYKAFAGRDRDWLDIEGIAIRQGPALDIGTIWRELTPLLELKEDEATAPRLHGLLKRLRA
jgi:hypothetical protein